jgi:hypothetical protein
VKPVRTNTWRIHEGDNAGAIEALDREGFDDLALETLEAISQGNFDDAERYKRFVDSLASTLPETTRVGEHSHADQGSPLEEIEPPGHSIEPKEKHVKRASNIVSTKSNQDESDIGDSQAIDVHDAPATDVWNGPSNAELAKIISRPNSVIGHTKYGVQRRYQYKKLPDVRTIRVLSIKRHVYKDGTESKSKFYYSLETVSLDDGQHYEAVSYVWGDNHLSKCLVLEDGSFVMITASLVEALPRLAESSITGYLWIDQLCIDQTTLAERNHQIKIMGEIYSRSIRVLIFLSHHELALKHLMPLFGYATNIEAGRLTPEYLEEHLSAKLETKYSKDYFRWKSVVTLLKHPWFTRAWVFQEAVLAPAAVFVIRDRIVPFDVLFRLAFTVNRIEIKYLKTWQENNCVSLASGYDHLYAIARLRRNLSRGVKERDFWELLSDIAPTSKCSIPVDIVYAFLGLMDDDTVQLEPDYSHTVRQAFIATARAVIFGRKSLDIFGFLEREDETTNTVSWAPHWRSFATVVSLWSPSKSSPFEAAKDRPFDSIENNSLLSHLPVKGNIVDIVVAITSPFTSAEHWSRRLPGAFLNLAKVGKTLVEAAGKEYEHCRNKRRLLRVALADGLLSHEHQNESSSPSQLLRKEKMDQLLSAYGSLASVNPDVPQSVEDRELCYLARIAFNRCICVTEKGHLALVPLATQVGDRVSILHGSKVPLVLRQQPKERMYNVVGPDYVEGMMEGDDVTWAIEEAKEYVLI